MRDVFGVFQFYNFLTQTDGEREREIEARNNQKIRREKEKLHSKNTYKTLAPPSLPPSLPHFSTPSPSLYLSESATMAAMMVSDQFFCILTCNQ